MFWPMTINTRNSSNSNSIIITTIIITWSECFLKRR